MFFPKLDKQSLTDGIVIPQMVKVHQSFPHKDLADPVGTLKQQLLALDEKTTASLPGKRIGITAGSRGLPHYKEIMKALCDQLKAWGAKPFVFPAMGSHAGATAEGQKAHLAQFGINEDYLGVPVLSTMDVVEVATLDDGFPVYCDKNAYEADGIILFNKIKPHTHFKYKHESGLLKMICIGCGKHKGASTFHGRGYDAFGPNLERVSKAFLQHVNVVFSVGMVQSPSDDIAALEVIPTDKFFERDAALQTMAKSEMPRLKLPHIDVLIVDETLSVGDVFFQEKCEARIKSFIDSGHVTVLFVSHSIEQVERICTRAVWIEKGQQRMDGPVEEVCRAYRAQFD